MNNELRNFGAAVVVSLALATVLLAVLATPSYPAATRNCHNAAYASGELVVKGVSCSAAARILTKALAHPGCRPSKADAMLGRGCNGSTRVGLWRCTGLFPGEGFDLRCHSGARRIHGGAGG